MAVITRAETGPSLARTGGIPLLTLIREDWQTHGRDWTHPGFRALAINRFAKWQQQELSRGLLRAVLWRLNQMLFRYVRNHYGIDLPTMTVLGRRVAFAHQTGIVIHPKAVIGDDCHIRQNVTIGALNGERADEAPTLGRGVEVGCGAAILGSISIGDGARIGPNAVVMTDVPPGATVFVNPPRMVLLNAFARPHAARRP